MTETDADLIELLMIPSVGRAKANALYAAGYRTLEDISNADPDDLAKVPGIGKEMARSVMDFVSVMLGASEKADPGKLGTDASLFVCPQCGSMVSEKTNVCSGCGIAFSDEVEEIDSEARELEIEDGEGPKLFICPECGSLIAEDSKKCANCGVRFDEDVPDDLTDQELKPKPEINEDGDEDKTGLFMCPNCGAFIPEEGDSCQNCGIVFEGEEEEDGTRPEPDVLVCPMCKKEMRAGSESCQDCGFDFTADKEVDGHWYKDKAELFMCPNCGAFISESANKCGSCGMEFSSDEEGEVVDEKPAKKADPDKEQGDEGDGYWYKDEDGLFMCPNCGAFIPKDADNCQTCGVVFEGEEEEERPAEPVTRTCPNCKSTIEPGMDSCPSCGLHFEVEEKDVDGFWFKDDGGLFVCPNCGTFISEKAKTCSQCGIVFEGIEEEKPEPREGIERPEEEFDRSLYLCPACGAFMSATASKCNVCGTVTDVEEEVEQVSDGETFQIPERGEELSAEIAAEIEDIEAETLEPPKKEIEELQTKKAKKGISKDFLSRWDKKEDDAISLVRDFKKRWETTRITDKEIEKELELDLLTVPEDPEEVRLEEIEDALESTPGNAELWAEKASILAELGRQDDAVACLDKAAELDPDKGTTYKKKMLVLLGVGMEEEEIDLSDLISLEEDGDVSLDEELMLERTEADIANIDEKLALNPKDETLWQEKGELLERLDRYEEAIQCFDESIRLSYADLQQESRGAVFSLKKQQLTIGLTNGEGRVNGRINGLMSQLGLVNGQGRTNGLVNGRGKVNGLINGLVNGRGRVNGLTNGLVNGRGRTNGLINGRGRTNGLINGEGRINGLVNGRGRTNGLVNGQGRVNGLINGLVNGIGLVNGEGFINGRGRFHATGQIARARKGWRYRVSWIVVLVALVLVIPMFSNLQSQSGVHSIAIDGNFSDWEVVPMFLDSPSDQIFNPDINILETKLVHDRDSINLFVRVEGVALSGQQMNAGQDRSETVDSIVAFIDLDSDPATGYAADGLGAEMIMEIYGWDNYPRSTAAYRFNEDGDHDDWNGFVRGGSAYCAVEGGRLEASVVLPTDLLTENAAPKVRMVAMNSLGYADVSDSTMSSLPASLQIITKGVGPDLLAPGEQDVVMVQIQARSYATSSTLTRMNFIITGSASTNDLDNVRLVADIDSDGYFNAAVDETLASGIQPLDQNNFSVALDEPLEISVNEDVELLLVADIDAGSRGRTVGLLMSGASAIEMADAVGTLVSVKNIDRTIHNIGAPIDIQIDGAFGDWATMSQNVDAANDVTSMASNYTLMNKNVDLADMRFGLDDQLFVYLSVSGVIMGGSDIPTVRMRPGPRANISTMDSDRDTVPDADDPMPHDFDNDGVNDADENGDLDNDGEREHRQGGEDYWLNTTIPDSFPANYSGNNVSVYVGPIAPVHVENLGQDHAYIMVDSDDDPMTGAATHGAIGADHVVVVSGKHNHISASGLYRYDPTHNPNPWTFVENVATAIDWYRMEARIDTAAMGIADDDNFTVFVSMEDWNGDFDVADVSFASDILDNIQLLNGTRSSQQDDEIRKPKNKLTVSKSVDNAHPLRGEFINYTITITNGLDYAVSGWLNDTLPAGVTGTDLYTTFTLAPGESISFVIMAQVNYDVPDNTWITNTAYVDYVDSTGNVVSLEASAKFKAQGGPIIIPEMQHITVVILGMMTVTFMGLRKKKEERP